MTASHSPLSEVVDVLHDLGYHQDYIKNDYTFATVVRDDMASEIIEIAAFSSDPPSFRTACIGVTTRSNSDIHKFGYLGAPFIISIPPDRVTIDVWSFNELASPKKIKTLKKTDLAGYVLSQEDWKPDSIFRAKSIAPKLDVASDLYDFGLVPTIEVTIQRKLNSLLSQTVARFVEDHKEIYNRDLTDGEFKDVFRVLFRFIAGKLLIDRQHPGDWVITDARKLLSAVSKFYFDNEAPIITNFDENALNLAWNSIHRGFPFQNISLETMSYVYENTFVDQRSREIYGTHATPPVVAEYVVDHLPLSDAAIHERKVFEPFSGHAPFLTAAYARMRQLLPKEIDRNARHKYLTDNIIGLELDAFAREVAYYCLILADYPNPSNWNIIDADFFDPSDSRAAGLLRVGNIILCNPPFGRFSQNEKDLYKDLSYAEKPFEVLHRILDAAPDMLGIILPRKFLTGESTKRLRDRLINSYNNIHLLTLPDNAFKFATVETVAISAYSTPENGRKKISRATVSRSQYTEFLINKQVKHQGTEFFEDGVENIRLWSSDILTSLLESTKNFPRLKDIADIHRGVSYIKPKLIMSAASSSVNFVQGIWNANKDFTPFIIKNTIYLNSERTNMDWGRKNLDMRIKAKVIVNQNAKSRGVWRLYAVPDTQGLLFYQNFTGIWPRQDLSVLSLSAILNSPIVNSLLSLDMDKGWHNTKSELGNMPIPSITTDQDETLSSYVTDFLNFKEDDYDTPYLAFTAKRKMLQSIDDYIFFIYDLSVELIENMLLHFIRVGPEVRYVNRDDIYEIRSELIDAYFTSGLDFDEMRALNYVDKIKHSYELFEFNDVIKSLELHESNLSYMGDVENGNI